MPPARRSKLRFALTLAAYLLAGVVTSLIIAWTRPFGNAYYGIWETRQMGDELEWVLTRSRYTRRIARPSNQTFVGPLTASEQAALASTLRAQTYVPQLGTVYINYPVLPVFWSVVFDGFPARCVWAVEDDRQIGANPKAPRHTFLVLPAWMDPINETPTPIAIKPVWSGLLINTACYSALWFAILFLPLRLMPWSKSSRRRRGLCTACGYDLTSSPTRCPECGQFKDHPTPAR